MIMIFSLVGILFFLFRAVVVLSFLIYNRKISLFDNNFFEKYNLLLRITIRMGEYTVYNDFSDYHGYSFDDEEFFDINQFFSNKELLELFDKLKRHLYESH